MRKILHVIRMGLLFCYLPLTAFGEINEVILFVNTAQGAIGHAQATESFKTMMTRLSNAHGFNLTIQDGRSNATWASTFAKIPSTDIIIFGNSGEPSFDKPGDQQLLINYFMNGGKGIGYHAAGDNSLYWDWWQNELHSEADFNGHGSNSFHLDKDPAVEAHDELSKMWIEHDLGDPFIDPTEIYKFTSYPRGKEGVTIMQTVRPPNNAVPNHEFTWLRDIGEGRYIYTALGHASADFNGGWLEKATWAFMEFLDGKYDAVQGCMDPLSGNWALEATADDGSCTYSGCMNEENTEYFCTKWPDAYPCTGTNDYSLADITPDPNACAIHVRDWILTQFSINAGQDGLVSISHPHKYTVKVVNVNGEEIIAETTSGTHKYDISKYQAGLYFIRVKSGSKEITKRVFIQ